MLVFKLASSFLDNSPSIFIRYWVVIVFLYCFIFFPSIHYGINSLVIISIVTLAVRNYVYSGLATLVTIVGGFFRATSKKKENNNVFHNVFLIKDSK